MVRINILGLNINYIEQGEGENVLILPGWGTEYNVYKNLIDNISLYSDEDINICIFMPNLTVKTYKNKDKYKMVKINNNTDLVFDNFFIYFKKGAIIYLNNDSFNLRESIIGKKYE